MGLFTRVAATIEKYLGIDQQLAEQILGVVLIVLAYLVVRRVIRSIAQKAVHDTSTRYQISKLTGYLLGVPATIGIVKILLPSLNGVATYLGLLSAGIAVALQDPLANLAGWFFIVLRRPFGVGDRIQVGSNIGDVVDIRIFQFVILEVGNWVQADQSTGRVIFLPNNTVFKVPLANYDKAFQYIWNEIPVVVTFESDWRAAKTALNGILAKHAEHVKDDVSQRVDQAANRYDIKFSKLTPVVWTSVVGDGVELTMRYLCKVRDRRSSTHLIWEAVLDEFAKLPHVDFAYRTVRHFDNANEGKMPLRATPSKNHTPVEIDEPMLDEKEST